MIFCRRPRLAIALVCLCFSPPFAAVAKKPAPKAQESEKAKPPEQKKQPNPFEAVPQSTEPPKPQAPKPPAPAAPAPGAPKAGERPEAERGENHDRSDRFRGPPPCPSRHFARTDLQQKGRPP